MPRPQATSTRQVAFLYDFTIDGGAVGSYNTGVTIPAGAISFSLIRRNIIAPVAAAPGSFLSYGVASNVALWGNEPDILYGSNNILLTLQISTGEPLLLTIVGQPLTAGKFSLIFKYEVTA